MIADILQTGSNGQLGWELQRRAASYGMTVSSFDRADLDITKAEVVARVMAAVRPKVVVNAAAYTAVDKAEKERDAAFAVNAIGPEHLAKACKAADVPLIHLSTDYVFDGQKKGAYTEDDPVAPIGVYGASKVAGEEAIRTSGARHLILRTAWVYGVHGQNFVKTMLRLGQDRDLLRVVGDQHGCPTYAADLAEVVLALARRVVTWSLPDEAFGTFHCVGGGETTWCEFARHIFEVARPFNVRTPQVDAITTAEYPTPAKRPANSVLDCTKLRRVHGLTLRPWEEALPVMMSATLTPKRVMRYQGAPVSRRRAI